jgi:hypothetical protein
MLYLESLNWVPQQVLLLAAEYQKKHLPECALHHIEALVNLCPNAFCTTSTASLLLPHTGMPHIQVATLNSVWLKKKIKKK